MGTQDVGVYLKVQPRTVHQWGYRHLLPPPDYVVNTLPVWERATILRWAGETGRIRDEGLAAEYREMLGREPANPRPVFGAAAK